MSEPKHDDGGPAFPTNLEQWNAGFAGMTVRDVFAAVALVGMYLADETCRRNVKDESGAGMLPGRTTAPEVASAAYEQAVAMIAEKRRREQT